MNWFESRNLRVLKYQQDAIRKVQESMSQREITVLAAAPSAGKTLMTIYVIEQYLKQHPNHKILVLAHGTTVLRTQFHDVLEENHPGFTYNLVEKFNEYNNNSDVNVCLPQTLAGNELTRIDLLVVDEAHQFYFAEKMMKEIIKKTKPQRQLLLTGTPSPFIRKGFKIIPVTLNTIFDEGMISDLYVEIATSSYSFDPMHDFNRDDELKTNVYIKDSETKKTLDDLIGKIVDRLKSIKDNPYQNLLPEWLPTLKKLQKTMIACRSQHQATQVKHYFDNINVKSALSISDIDYDSREIERFKEDTECLILIVVGRGILGFNYPELVNVVDMTTSQNVDRIYQLLCRVIRKHPDGHKKLFFKVAPNIHSDYYKYIMTAVLSMSDESFFTKFNGKNFSDMVIPVVKSKQDHHGTGTGGGGTSRPKTLKAVDFGGLPVFEFFKDLYHKKDALLHVYAYTTVRDVRGEFLKEKPNGYWTKEKCLEDALIYTNKRDWARNSSSAQSAARKNGWYNECTAHMKNMITFWTKKECIESALKYSTKSEWERHEVKLYRAASHNKWLDECCEHMTDVHNSWTKEKCLESALKYQTKVDWIKNDTPAYGAARRNGWFDECTKHMSEIRIIWTKEKCLEDALKYNKIIDWQKSGGAYEFARKNGCLDECVAHMIKSRNKWTKEECIESALKYNTISEWDKNERKAHHAASGHKWMNECTSHMKILNISWSLELCLESALKYKTITEWDKNDNRAYGAARRNGWFDECTKHMTEIIKPSGYWTKENCILEAQKYKTFKEFRINSSGAYSAAKNNGWFEECSKNLKRLSRNAYTKEECIESSSKYSTKSEWANKGGGAYNAAKNNGWLDDSIQHMKVLKIFWTKDDCLSNALKYESSSEWNKNENSAYNASKRNGWFDECTARMNKPHKWTKEECLKTALQYDTKSEWVIKCGGAYDAAKRNGWFDECAKHMIKRNNWTKENCIEDALKYLTKSEWKSNNGAAYNAADANGWLEECTQHMNKRIFITKDMCIESAYKYQTSGEWLKNNNSEYCAAKRKGWFDECTAHMKKK